MRYRNTTLAVAAVALFSAGCDSPTDAAPDATDLMRQATEAYSDVNAAMAAGFVQLSECVESPAGGMGFHYGMPARLGDAVIDPSLPEVLLYEPTENGGLVLAGVEFMMHQDAWAASGGNAPPQVAGQDFAPPNPEHPDEQVRPFHTLHAWVWKDNPNGVFSPFNPSVTCG